MFVSCFIPEYDAIFHAQKIAKRDCPFLLLPDFGRITRPMNPISLPSTPQNSTSAPLFRCPEPRFLIPQTAFWGIPFCHLEYFKACLCPHIGAVLPSLRADFFPLQGQKWSTKRMFKPAVERKSDNKKFAPMSSCRVTTSSLMSSIRHKSLQQESQEVWEGIELTVETDILISQLDAVFYIRKFIFFQQIIQ